MKTFIYASPKENILFEVPDQIWGVFNQALAITRANRGWIIGGRRYHKTFDILAFYASLPPAWKQQIRVRRDYEITNGYNIEMIIVDEKEAK